MGNAGNVPMRGLHHQERPVFVCSLGSGSSGNALLIRSASRRTLLIDAGVQFPRLCKNLARLGVRLGDIDAVILSHEHSDHTQSARPLHETAGIPIIASVELARDAPWLTDIITDTFDPSSARTLGDVLIAPYAVSHDTSAAYGFELHADGCTLAIFTDLGGATDDVRAAVSRADLVVIEANYDRDMLDNGSYPWFLKSRIKGRGGHLSNAECAELLVQAFADDRPRDVWLAHLSTNNNTPQKAVETVSMALIEAGIHRTHVAALPRYTNGPTWDRLRHQQLMLFSTPR
jgi:phosphoribosyl 1,2-cyclic phosphodiesterase